MKFQLGDHPAKVLITSYLIAIFVGMVLLMFPAATVSGSLSPLSALFTATSAVCVTGLSVVDTGSTFTLFGQLVILFLIELGGIGIMTFSTFFALLLFQRISYLEQKFLLETLAGFKARNFVPLIAMVFLSALVIQAIGAVLLTPFFSQGRSFSEAIYYGVFHSISAFCNAGLSLIPGSLAAFRTHVWVNLIVIGLVIFGGLGFIVYVELYRKFRAVVTRTRFRLGIHSKLVLITSLALLAIGTLSFFALEHGNLLKDFPAPMALLISFFHAVTPRTAGFSTLDLSQLTNATAFILITLMFVGGAPGSTAGGVKVTTLAVFFLLIRSQLQDGKRPFVFGRTITASSILKTMTLLVVAVLIISTAVVLLQITESAGLPHEETRTSFLELFFESVSAFSTVGLSMGATEGLTANGKILIILLMFIGRIGPLTLLLLITFRRGKNGGEFEYAEEDVAIG